MGLALELRRHLPNIRLNETHPKVLFYAITGKRYRPADLASAVEWFASYSSLTIIGDISNDDQFDALLSAWATRQDTLTAGRIWLAPTSTIKFFQSAK